MKRKICKKYRRKTKSLKREKQKIKQKGGKIRPYFWKPLKMLLSLEIN